MISNTWNVLSLAQKSHYSVKGTIVFSNKQMDCNSDHLSGTLHDFQTDRHVYFVLLFFPLKGNIPQFKLIWKVKVKYTVLCENVSYTSDLSTDHWLWCCVVVQYWSCYAIRAIADKAFFLFLLCVPVLLMLESCRLGCHCCFRLTPFSICCHFHQISWYVLKQM